MFSCTLNKAVEREAAPFLNLQTSTHLLQTARSFKDHREVRVVFFKHTKIPVITPGDRASALRLITVCHLAGGNHGGGG